MTATTPRASTRISHGWWPRASTQSGSTRSRRLAPRRRAAPRPVGGHRCRGRSTSRSSTAPTRRAPIVQRTGERVASVAGHPASWRSRWATRSRRASSGGTVAKARGYFERLVDAAHRRPRRARHLRELPIDRVPAGPRRRLRRLERLPGGGRPTSSATSPASRTCRPIRPVVISELGAGQSSPR